MEDLDILFEDDLEGDFIDLVIRNWPRDMFILSATAMLGDSWTENGELILKEHAPELLDVFISNYKNPKSEG